MIRDCTYLKSRVAAVAILMSISTSAQKSLCLNFGDNAKAADWDLKSATNAVTINIGEDLSIYNISGSKVFCKNSTDSNLSVNVTKGIYIVHLSGAQAKVVVK